MGLDIAELTDSSVTDWAARSLVAAADSHHYGSSFLTLNVGGDEFDLEMDRMVTEDVRGCAVRFHLTRNAQDVTAEFAEAILGALKPPYYYTVASKVTGGRTGIVLVFAFTL